MKKMGRLVHRATTTLRLVLLLDGDDDAVPDIEQEVGHFRSLRQTACRTV